MHAHLQLRQLACECGALPKLILCTTLAPQLQIAACRSKISGAQVKQTCLSSKVTCSSELSHLTINKTNVRHEPQKASRNCSRLLTSCEGCDLALLIECVGEALWTAQHLLVGGLEALLEKLERAHMSGCHSGGEPNPKA